MPSLSSFDKAQAANKDKNYEEALSFLEAVLKDNPKHLNAHLESAISHAKLKDLNKALYWDCYHALEIAAERKNKPLFSQVYFRIAVIFNQAKDYHNAYRFFKLAHQYGYENTAEIEIWLAKVLDKLNLDVGTEKFLAGLELGDSNVFAQFKAKHEELYPKSEKREPKQVKSEEPQPKVIEPKISEIKEPITQQQSAVQYPLVDKVRKEFFETDSTVTVSIYIKKVPKDSFKIDFLPRSVEFEFKTPSGSDYMYEIDNLVGEIVPKECSYTIFGTKIELVLEKKEKGLWKSLQGAEQAAKDEAEKVLSYPSSATKKIDWALVDKEYKNLEEDEEDDMKLFKEIYKGADDDTRRAMMKSYIESNGTALSTNWDEVSKKKYEIDPPDSMVAKKWGE